MAEVLTVINACGSVSGLTVVAASEPGHNRVVAFSHTEAASVVPSTAVIMVVGRLAVTIAAASSDAVTDDATGTAEAVSVAAGTLSLKDTVIITVVDIRRVNVPPAGMDGCVDASSGIAVADCCGELGPDTDLTVTSGLTVVVVDCSGEPAAAVAIVVVAGIGLLAED